MLMDIIHDTLPYRLAGFRFGFKCKTSFCKFRIPFHFSLQILWSAHLFA